MSETSLPNLQLLRTKRGISRADLAKILDVAERTVGRWENGDNEPNLSELRRIASHFAVSVGYLIGETPKGPMAVPTGTMMASELVAKLQGIIGDEGDLPVVLRPLELSERVVVVNTAAWIK